MPCAQGHILGPGMSPQRQQGHAVLPGQGAQQQALCPCGLNAIERQGSCVLLFCIKDPSCY